MKRLMDVWFVCILFSFISASSIYAIVLDFEDLTHEQHISGTNYAGLFWEQGNQGYQGNEGAWACPPTLNNHPHSGTHNLCNTWGCTLIGIQFPDPVNVIGAYFAAQGDKPWTTGIRVHGYLNNVKVTTTNWFRDIDMHPDWFEINLNNIDRFVIESIPADEGDGIYGMDDLTFVIPEPVTMLLLAAGGLFLRQRRK